jgi:hypothetical protein
MFSADGTQVYYVAMDSASATRMNGNGFTGVWATALDGTTRRLWDDTGRDIVIPEDDIPLADLIKAKLAVIPTSEPAAVAIGTRNFTGQTGYAATISQVLFNGTGVSGNIGGINALVDDRNPNNLTDPNWTPSIYVALENQRLFDILGLGHIDLDDVANASIIGSLPKVWGIVSDAEGVIYFATTSPQTLFQYDTKGRLIALGTRAQHLAFNLITMPSQSAPTNTAYNRTQLRTIPAPYDADETLTQVLFMSTPEKGVFGVTVYKPIDFDRDGSVTLADLNFFKTQIQKTRTETAPSVLLAGTSTDPNIIVDTQEVIDYLKADISGNIETVGSNRTTGWTFNAGVDEKDIEVLHQFVVPGDVNLDYSINLADLISFAENFYGTDKDWSHGDFDFDGDVDLDDFALLSAHWMETYEE